VAEHPDPALNTETKNQTLDEIGFLRFHQKSIHNVKPARLRQARRSNFKVIQIRCA